MTLISYKDIAADIETLVQAGKASEFRDAWKAAERVEAFLAFHRRDHESNAPKLV